MSPVKTSVSTAATPPSKHNPSLAQKQTPQAGRPSEMEAPFAFSWPNDAIFSIIMGHFCSREDLWDG